MGKMALTENQELLGRDGVHGRDGVAGRDGVTGEKGEQGLPGRDGVAGERGEQGPTGPRSGGVTYVRWGKDTCQIYQEQKEYTKVGLLEVITHTREEVATTSVSLRSPRTLILVLELWMHLTFMGWNIKCLAIYQGETIT